MPTDSHAHEFRLLRNRIEAEIHAPALLFVTSATETDGAGFAAYGVAESLSKTHQRTVLVTSDPSLAAPTKVASAPLHQRRASDKLETKSRPTQGDFSIICLSERVNTISRSRVAEMIAELRADNDYVVVDAGNLAKNGLGLMLIGSSDVAIVAFRSGRAQQDADRFMLDALERAESKLIGVVMTDQETIEHFAQRDAPAVVPEESPVRKGAPVLKRLELALSRLVKQG